MSGTTMIFLIVLVSVGFGAIREIYITKLELKKRSTKGDQDVESLKTEISALKERIVVLEKLVTDDGYQVSKDISKL
ncbi:hypothetical protein CWB96_02330 [Pseudoalteromonas citrea]|uniref:Nitrite reductase n=2 Tax=Pseudoalteromonas TaxID=53246 RepID=A0A5S3VBX1_9GAMM|nr:MULTISPECIES: hypothetical protein [Pseudoalteromonas]TMO63331.1 hypothetical protein CWC18_08875 [Pseudoalteromonas aurantia]TMO69550.1 hypothetical protein CWC19_05125 [Pseudoalteromonas aurantia]TMO74350.1 hypothetical protein CWC20_10440 [Pseudoalteromonas aurantia]TMP43410.1 hypothetical protein CWB97_09190 [Pseudoalteromonas citrea]TMP62191.1 hypothetical protein CWB96_02330 [Pseudoalteromonas citrea]